MSKVLYYVVEKELVDATYCGGEEFIQSTTGDKTVTTYTVENNKIEKFFHLDLSNEDNSEEEIQNYLDDNGYGDDAIELIQL